MPLTRVESTESTESTESNDTLLSDGGVSESKSNFKAGCFLLLFSASIIFSSPQEVFAAGLTDAELGQVARRLSGRLRGGAEYTLESSEIIKMVELLKAGKAQEAADIPSRHRDFLEVTVRRFASPMINIAQKERITMNDALATIIGHVKDDQYFHEILYRTMRYEITHNCCAGGRPSDYANYDLATVTYDDYGGGQRSAEAPALLQFLKRTDSVSRGSGQNGEPAPNNEYDAAGILASDYWAASTNNDGIGFYEAGTNRAAIKGLIQMSCMDIEEIRSLEGSRSHIARDVSPLPDPFQPLLFDTYCSTCHYFIDGVRDAFGRLSANTTQRAIFGFSPPQIQGKYISSNEDIVDQVNLGNIKDLPNPNGHVTTNANWEVNLPESLKKLLGWNGPLKGTGAIEFGQAWSKMKRFNTCMVERAVKVVCPGAKLTTDVIDKLAVDFEKDGLMRKVFTKVATLPHCLGVTL